MSTPPPTRPFGGAPSSGGQPVPDHPPATTALCTRILGLVLLAGTASLVG